MYVLLHNAGTELRSVPSIVQQNVPHAINAQGAFRSRLIAVETFTAHSMLRVVLLEGPCEVAGLAAVFGHWVGRGWLVRR